MKLPLSNGTKNFLLIFSALFLIFLGFILFALYLPEYVFWAGWILAIVLFIGAVCLWLKVYKKQPTKTIVLTVILGVLAYSAYIWLGTLWHVHLLNEEWYYPDPILSHTVIQNVYTLAFQKIVLVAGLSFSVLAFWLKVFNKNK